MSAAALAVPAVLQPDSPVAELGAGDQVEPVGLGDVVEPPGTLARNVTVQVQAELVDQVEPHERPPEANAAPDHDVAVAASLELVDLPSCHQRRWWWCWPTRPSSESGRRRPCARRS